METLLYSDLCSIIVMSKDAGEFWQEAWLLWLASTLLLLHEWHHRLIWEALHFLLLVDRGRVRHGKILRQRLWLLVSLSVLAHPFQQVGHMHLSLPVILWSD